MNSFLRNSNVNKGLLDSGQGSSVNIILKQYQLANIMEKQVERRAGMIDLEGSDVSQSTEYRHLDNKEIDQLYASYNLMKQFSEKIPLEKVSSISQILEIYAERPIKFELLSKNVMHILDKRIQRMLKNKRLKKNWSSQDAEILCWTFCYYCQLNGINSVEQTTQEDWHQISKLIPGSNPDSCMFKILSFKKVKLAKQKWTEEQSRLLQKIASQSTKKNWKHIAQELYKSNPNPSKIFRNAKQCKEHWVCYLNPDLKKGSWTLEEDRLLMKHVYKNNGYRKWAQIARIFGGRTENALKNRYTLIIQRLRRQKNILDCQHDMQLIKDYLSKIKGSEQDSTQLKPTTNSKKQPQTKPNPEQPAHPVPATLPTLPTQTPQQHENTENNENLLQKMLLSFYPFPSSMGMAPTYFNCENFNSVPVHYVQNNANSMFFVYPGYGALGQK